MATENFVHRYLEPTETDLPTLLLLHGTGGDENDLLPLGPMLLPGAGLLSPRGKVSEHGMNRYFRRVAEGVFDLDDLKIRTDELAAFIPAAAQTYSFDPHCVVAVGFSNGANIAASLLLTHPTLLAGAVLLHAQVPLHPADEPDLSSVPIFLSGGRQDRMISATETERLERLLRTFGAQVEMHWEPGGHSLTQPELEAAGRWLATFAATIRRP